MLRDWQQQIITSLKTASRTILGSCIQFWMLVLNRAMRATEQSVSSLANRILLLQIAWAILVGVLVIGSLWWGSSKVIEGSFQRQGEGWIQKLDELGTPLYASDSTESFAEITDYLKNFPEISSVQFFDEKGTGSIAEYYRDGQGSGQKYVYSEKELESLLRIDGNGKPKHFRSSDRTSVFHISAPVWIKSVRSDGMFDFSLDEPANETVHVIGILRVGLDYSSYQQELEADVLVGSGIIVALLILTAFAGRILIRWALRPLLQLEDPLNRLARGETDVEVESSGDREIAQIGMVLNTTISALKERDETLRRMANHDPLTGLVNRGYFSEKLEKELQRMGQEGGSSALFFIDLDRFKFINDTYGHAAGDRLLIAVSNLLKQRMRDGDLISRFGGDEFTALVHNVDRKQAKDIASSLLSLMQNFQFHEAASEPLRIYFSIGITVFDSGLLSAHDVLLQADTAVHEAKSRGRNRFHLYEASGDILAPCKNQGWHERIRNMLDQESILLYYQPLMGLKEGHERICEVLIRMPDSGRDVILPSAFFPAAERFGLMAEVDRQVIRKAAKWLSGLSDREVVVSINLSQQSFEEEGLEEYLTEQFDEFSLDTRQFIFEIDESVAVRNAEKMRPLMERITALGCRFAIDNFGAGYASFDFLKHFQVHNLNIDNKLIENLEQEPIHQITVRSIVKVAQELEMQTVAKFVQDDFAIQHLRQSGVGYAQGNFLCEALPVEENASPRLTVVK